MDFFSELKERQEKAIAKNMDIYIMLVEEASKEYEADKAATMERIRQRQSEIEQEELKDFNERHSVTVYSDEMKNFLKNLMGKAE